MGIFYLQSTWLELHFSWENPFGFWKGWAGKTPGNFQFPWRTGEFNSASVCGTLVEAEEHCKVRYMRFTTLLPWIALRHGPIKSERNWGARGTFYSRNSFPANNNCLFKRSVLNHTACCSGRINAIAQSVGEIRATHPTSLLGGVAQTEPGKTQEPPPHGHTKRAWLLLA